MPENLNKHWLSAVSPVVLSSITSFGVDVDTDNAGGASDGMSDHLWRDTVK